MTPQFLHQAIVDAGCPVISVTCGDPIVRTTWTYQLDPSATPAQIAIANNIVATLSPVIKNTIQFDDFIRRWTNAEYQLLLANRASAASGGSMAIVKQWDIAFARGIVDLNKTLMQNLKSDIVSAGILTQARADEIFA